MEAQRVELVEDQSFLESVLDALAQLGPLFIAAAALFAAYKAWTKADSRLAAQLAHDRDLRRDDHIRDALDDALEIVGATAREVGQMQSVLNGAGWRKMPFNRKLEKASNPDERAELKAEIDAISRDARASWEKAFARVDEFHLAITRLQLRLGASHEIPQAAESLADRWEEARHAYEPMTAGKVDPTRWTRAQERRDEVISAYDVLRAECETWLTEKGAD